MSGLGERLSGFVLAREADHPMSIFHWKIQDGPTQARKNVGSFLD
jgi:hypothetical protein